MVAHDNIHIPTESFPHWIWFVIEFAIVLAVSAILSKEATGAIEGLDEIMQNSDIVSLHIPPNKDKTPTISKDKLIKMKSTSLLLNALSLF